MNRRSVLLFALVVLAWLPARAQQGEMHMHNHFGDAERWAQVFDDPQRDTWQMPDEVLRALALAPDATVADIGSGTGYFAVRLARAVPKGHVYGADLSHDMVHYLNQRAAKEGLANLSSHLAAPDDARLPARVDLALLVDTYHHIGDRERYFAGLRASLKPGGRVAVIDFRLDAPSGPPRADRVPPERVKAEMAKAGYRLAAEHGFLPEQYFLVFTPSAD